MQLIFLLPIVMLVVGCVIFAFYKIGKFKRLHKPKVIIYKKSIDKNKTDEV